VKTATILRGLPDRPIEAGQEADVLNREIVPVIQSMRTALNCETVIKVTSDNPAGTAAYRVWESERVPDDGAWLMELHAFGTTEAGGWRGALRFMMWTFTDGVGTIRLSNSPLNNFGGTGFAGTPTLSFDATKKVIFTIHGGNSLAGGRSVESSTIKIQEVVL